MKKDNKLNIKDIKEISNMYGRSEDEIMDTVNEMVDKGLFKVLGKNKYDITPFVELNRRFSEQTQKGGSVDIKKLYQEVTNKRI